MVHYGIGPEGSFVKCIKWSSINLRWTKSLVDTLEKQACGDFVLCQFSWTGTMFPNISLPVNFWPRVGHKENICTRCGRQEVKQQGYALTVPAGRQHHCSQVSCCWFVLSPCWQIQRHFSSCLASLLQLLWVLGQAWVEFCGKELQLFCRSSVLLRLELARDAHEFQICLHEFYTFLTLLHAFWPGLLPDG